MSLHAKPSYDVIRRLHAQRRNSTISSLAVALLSVVLIALTLGHFLLPRLIPGPVDFVAIETGWDEDPPEKPKPVRTRVTKKPASPSRSAARVMTVSINAPVSVATSDFELAPPSLEFGIGDDFADGWDGTGNGSGAGDGGAFGSSSRSSGGLEGCLYDFKQKPGGGEISYDLANRSEFTERIVRLQRSKFSEASLSRYFQAPKRLFLTHLAIPLTGASSGPAFFGAEDSIRPSGWMVHYHGKLTVPKSGRYRFSGLGDDYIAVMLNRRLRLAACWPDIQDAIGGRWDPSEPTGSFMSPFSNKRLIYGDWVKLREGETIDLDLAIGERPGGQVGFVLHIEEKGVEYRKAADGRPILPLFTTVPFSDAERSRISREFGSYEFEWDRVPVFRAQ